MPAFRERKLEWAVAAAAAGLLLYFLLLAVETVQRETEEAMVQSEASALRVEILDRLSRHQAVGGALPESANPVAWAGRAPAGYLGERQEASAAGGVWYFDAASEVLVYRYRRGGEAKFRLVRVAGAQNAPATLGGIGLARLEN